LPLIIGTNAIGRVAALGADATALKIGELVLVDSAIRGRDEGTNICLGGVHEGFTEGSRKLMAGEWRDGTYAEFVKVPLENVFVFDEGRLFGSPENGGLAYREEDLMFISCMLVPWGGTEGFGVKAGRDGHCGAGDGHVWGCGG
jgi:threonine dehydrogenase-like Zn-dependent dehydrogenase